MPSTSEKIRLALVLRSARPRRDDARPRHADDHGARPEDAAVVAAFARKRGWRVVDADPARRRVLVEGPLAGLAAALGLRYALRGSGGDRVPTAAPRLPPELQDLVVAVLGLDTRPRLRPHVHAHRHHAPGHRSTLGGHTPLELAARYRFPAGTGRGLRIGLLELGGGYRRADLVNFFGALGLPLPTVRTVGVEGARNRPKGSRRADRLEVGLDLEVLGALVPEAELVVYFAPNSDLGFYEALQAALKDPDGAPEVLSISWGHSELQWDPMVQACFEDALEEAAARGITVLVSAGDRGSREGGRRPQVNYPASSAWVLGCGGTSLDGADDIVWNRLPSGGATGGGISRDTARPAWQRGVARVRSALDGRSGRGVPDVAVCADQRTGYRVFILGQWWVLGGTSAAAPLWAGLLARCAERLGRRPGFLNPVLYQDPAARAALRPVTRGRLTDYAARAPWCACAGLGTPDGEALLAALAARDWMDSATMKDLPDLP